VFKKEIEGDGLFQFVPFFSQDKMTGLFHLVYFLKDKIKSMILYPMI